MNCAGCGVWLPPKKRWLSLSKIVCVECSAATEAHLRDTDGTATAAANGDLPVPQDCQAGARSASPIIDLCTTLLTNQEKRTIRILRGEDL